MAQRTFFSPLRAPLNIFSLPDTLAATSARGGAPMRAGRSHRRSDLDGSRPRHGASRSARRGNEVITTLGIDNRREHGRDRNKLSAPAVAAPAHKLQPLVGSTLRGQDRLSKNT